MNIQSISPSLAYANHFKSTTSKPVSELKDTYNQILASGDIVTLGSSVESKYATYQIINERSFEVSGSEDRKSVV